VAADEQFNVPQPLFTYLQEVGTYTEKMGKETELGSSPTTNYHAETINTDTYNLFEEVLSLGIAGNIVMALTAKIDKPEPNFHVRFPENTVPSENLVRRFYPIDVRRPKIKQRLTGLGITPTHFPKYVPNTRFNLRYISSISDIIRKFETIRIEKVNFKSLTNSGGQIQVIKMTPPEMQNQNKN
jgi:hypothetical protein